MIRFQHTLLTIFLCLFFLPLVIGGCASLGPTVEKPVITIIDLQVVEGKPLEMTFMLELRIMNPNDFSLDIKGLNCDLRIDGHRFAVGISDAKQEVPAFGTATIPVTVYASIINVVGSGVQILRGIEQDQGIMKSLPYELSGKIRVGGGVSRSIPFQSKGELNLNTAK